MSDNPKRPRDANQLAKMIVDLSTGENSEGEKKPKQKIKAKSESGKMGAKKRNSTLTPSQRTEIASIAASVRWKKSN